MPTYVFRCEGCSEPDFSIYLEFDRYEWFRDAMAAAGHSNLDGSICRGPVKPVLNFSFHRGTPGHFNHSLGTYLTNDAAAASALSRQSDEATARTGVTHSYELVDPREKSALGITDEGLEATEKRAVEDGKVAPKLYL